MENEEWNRVVKRLCGKWGSDPVICDRCKATLRSFADKCKVSYRQRCPGVETVDAAAIP